MWLKLESDCFVQPYDSGFYLLFMLIHVVYVVEVFKQHFESQNVSYSLTFLLCASRGAGMTLRYDNQF